MNAVDSPEIGEGTLRHATVLKRRFFACLPLGLLVMVLSMIPAWQFPGWQWVVAVAALPVVTWGAWPFHRAACQAGRHGTTTMDTLVSLGVCVSSLWSYGALFFGGAGKIGMTMSMSLIPRGMHESHAHLYFEAATMIVVFLLGGRWAEAKSRYRAGDALREILTLGAKEATILKRSDNGETGETTIPAAKLLVGDLMVVQAGEKIPTDGVVVTGTSAVDNSLLTGESIPEDVATGDAVVGGAVNTWGLLHIKATRVGRETTLAQIGRLVTQAQASKAPIQRLADQVSSVFVPIIIVLSMVTFGVWLSLGYAWTTALTCAVAVLVVACPCALGLATPTALLVGSGRAAQLGIVIRNAEVLENTRRIDTVVLDKTGTVTTGRIQVDNILPLKSSLLLAADGESGQTGQNKRAEQKLLALGAAVESGSEHPLALAIRKQAQKEGLQIPTSSAFTNHPGGGVSATVQGQSLWLGSPRWVSERGAAIPDSLHPAIEQAEASGATVSVLVTAGEIPVRSIAGEPALDNLDHTVCVDADADGDTGGEPSAGSEDSSALDLDSALANSNIAGGLSGDVSGEEATANGRSDANGFAVLQQVVSPGASKIRVEMRVEGMTCAACVRRVEKKLSKLEGVTPSVNLATEIATIELVGDWDNAALEKVVNDAGYRGYVLEREIISDPRNSNDSIGFNDAGNFNDINNSSGSNNFSNPGSHNNFNDFSQVKPLASNTDSSGTSSGQALVYGGTRNRAETIDVTSNDREHDCLDSSLHSFQSATVLGAIVLRDQIKADAFQAVGELKRMHIEPVLLTGDNQAAANQVAKQIGITNVVAQVRPDQKRQKVVELQRDGRQVAMVGDGINDAAALAQASNQGLSIAMGQGTDLAIAVADITLMRDTLTSVPQAIRLSRRTLNTIKGNLFWAFFYNVAMVPLAAFGLLNPMLASAAMACSSVFVVLNSLRLKTQK